MDQISLQAVLDMLKPAGIWDIFLYLYLIFVFITLFMQEAGAVTTTILLAIVIVGGIIDKVNVFGECGLEVMLMRIMFFFIPLVVAGITKAPKSRAPAIIASVLGGVYMFSTWFFILKANRCPSEEHDTILIPASLYLLRRVQTQIMVDSTKVFDTHTLKS